MPKKTADKKPKKIVKKSLPDIKEEQVVEKPQPTPLQELPEPQPPSTPAEAEEKKTPEVKLVLDQTVPSADAVQPAVTNTSPAATPDISSTPPPTSTQILTDTTQPVVETAGIETAAGDDFEPEHGGRGLKIFLIFLTALLVGGAAVAGFLYYSQKPAQQTTPQVETPTNVPAEPSPEPVASGSASETDLAALSVQILNGSGTAGEAARVRDALQGAGFEKFSLGNASSYDYTDTEVQVKEGLPGSVFQSISEALSEYTVVEETALPASNSHDVVITVGKKK